MAVRSEAGTGFASRLGLLGSVSTTVRLAIVRSTCRCLLGPATGACYKPVPIAASLPGTTARISWAHSQAALRFLMRYRDLESPRGISLSRPQATRLATGP